MNARHLRRPVCIPIEDNFGDVGIRNGELVACTTAKCQFLTVILEIEHADLIDQFPLFRALVTANFDALELGIF